MLPPDRRSGMDWLGTLFLIRRMAWGETLIWTSSAWKKTALPGWAQRTGTANYTTFKLPPCQLSSIPLSVCVCECASLVCVHERVFTGSLFFSNPQTCSSGMDWSPLDINNFSPLMISLSAASSCSLHIFVRVWRKGGVVSPKGGSRFVPALCLITPPLHTPFSHSVFHAPLLTPASSTLFLFSPRLQYVKCLTSLFAPSCSGPGLSLTPLKGESRTPVFSH